MKQFGFTFILLFSLLLLTGVKTSSNLVQTSCLLFDQLALPASLLGTSQTHVQLVVEDDFPLIHYTVLLNNNTVYCGLSERTSSQSENKKATMVNEFCYQVDTSVSIISDSLNTVGEYQTDEKGKQTIADPHRLRSYLISILSDTSSLPRNSARKLYGSQCRQSCCQEQKDFLKKIANQDKDQQLLEKLNKDENFMAQLKSKRRTEEAFTQDIYISYSQASSVLFSPPANFFSYASAGSVSVVYADGTLFLFSKSSSSFSSPPSFTLQLNLTNKDLKLNFNIEELVLVPVSSTSFRVLLLRTGKYFAASKDGNGKDGKGRGKKTGRFSNLVAVVSINQNGNAMSLGSIWRLPFDESFYKDGVVYYISSLSSSSSSPDFTVTGVNVVNNQTTWSFTLSSSSTISLASIDDFFFTPSNLIVYTTLTADAQKRNLQFAKRQSSYLLFNKKYFYITLGGSFLYASPYLSRPSPKIPIFYLNQNQFFYVATDETSPYLTLASTTPYSVNDEYSIPNVPGFAASGLSAVYPDTSTYLASGPAPSIFDSSPVGYASLQVQNFTESFDSEDQIFFFHLVDISQHFAMSIPSRVLHIGYYDAKASFDRSSSPQVLHMYGYKKYSNYNSYYEYDYLVSQAALLQPGQFLPPSPSFPARPAAPTTPAPTTQAPTPSTAAPTTTAPTTAVPTQSPSTSSPSTSTPISNSTTASPVINETIVLTLPPQRTTSAPTTATTEVPTSSPPNDTIVLTLPPARTTSAPSSTTPSPTEAPVNDSIVLTLPPARTPSAPASTTPSPTEAPVNDSIVLTLPPARTIAPSTAQPTSSNDTQTISPTTSNITTSNNQTQRVLSIEKEYATSSAISFSLTPKHLILLVILIFGFML